MKAVISVMATLVLFGGLAGAAQTHQPKRSPAAASEESRTLMPVTKTTRTKKNPQVRCPATLQKIEEFKQKTWEAQSDLNKRLTSASTAPIKSCAYARWVVEKWRNRSEAAVREHKRRVIPNTNDWVTAVRVVQKIYPGTSEWMLYISDREGGHGPWVWYGGRTWAGYHVGDDFLGADTVGGWMQFRFSTFAPYWRQMLDDLSRRGYVLPDIPNYGGPAEYQPWLWPLGQALTAGYMKYYGKEACHWCL